MLIVRVARRALIICAIGKGRSTLTTGIKIELCNGLLKTPFLVLRIDRGRSVALASLGAERSAATAGSFHVRVVEHESRLHQLVFVIKLGAIEMKNALRIE